MDSLHLSGITVYQGSEPYLFVSYAHKDSALVVPMIKALQAKGFRVWFDMGIEAGTEWSNNIAIHLKNCACFLFFVSDNSVTSENCLDEVAFAKTHAKPSLMVFLEEDVVLPEGTDMQTARFQRMYRNRHPSQESFIETLSKAPVLKPCLEIQPKPVGPVKSPVQVPIAQQTAVEEAASQPAVEEVKPIFTPAAPAVEEPKPVFTPAAPVVEASPVVQPAPQAMPQSPVYQNQQPVNGSAFAPKQPKVKKAKGKKGLVIGLIAILVVVGLLIGFVSLFGTPGKYYLAYAVYDGERFYLDDLDLVRSENYLILRSDGTGIYCEDGYEEDIEYDDYDIWYEGDESTYSPYSHSGWTFTIHLTDEDIDLVFKK